LELSLTFDIESFMYMCFFTILWWFMVKREEFPAIVKSQFRIVIPKNIRESLGLKIGDKIRVVIIKEEKK